MSQVASKKTWVQRGNDYYLNEVSNNVDILTPGVYKINMDERENPYVSKVSNGFSFPYKVYGV